MKEIIEIELPERIDKSEGTSLYELRSKIASSFRKNDENESEATIFIQAYNRLDKTKQCISNILEHTKNVYYDLILFDNGSTDNTFDYFKSIDYDRIKIIRLSKNIGSPVPVTLVNLNWISKYFVYVQNDIIVTENWLSNLIKVAESDPKIGMVNPASSNVSNMQEVLLDFSSMDEMQEKAKRYNKSDPSKWHQRMRLITLSVLFTKECLFAVGPQIFDVGFIHDFGDDDISFRIRRAGYKIIFAQDTWIHHNHDFRNMENKNPEEYKKSLKNGLRNFKEKYYGVDAWNDVNNFVPEILPSVNKTNDKDNCSILGVDVKCGTPILEIKNKLRSFGIFEPESCAITSEGKYFIDLQTVCGADNVLAGSPDTVSSDFENESFDYIIIGNNINEYPEPLKILKKIYALLKKGGQMYIYLKNTFDVYSFLNVIGYSQVMPTSYAYNFSVEKFAEILESYSIPAELVTCIPYINIPDEYAAEVNKRAESFVKENAGVTQTKLTCDKYLFKLSK